MGKTLLMVPRKEMIKLARSLMSEFPGAVDEVRCPVSAVTVVDEAMHCIADGTDVIIATGLQAINIQKNCSIAVVTMRMTTQDVALQVSQAKRLCNVPNPKIALVGAFNMLPDVSAFNRLFDVNLEVYTYTQFDDLNSTVTGLTKRKPDALIIDEVDIEQTTGLGIPVLHMSPTEESIRESIRTSLIIRQAIEMRKQSDARCESLFTGAFNGFILFDNHGSALRCNPASEFLLSCTEKEIIGKNIQTLFPKLDNKKFLDAVENGSVSTEYIDVKRQNYVVVLKPVLSDGKTDGVVLSFRKFDKSFDRWEATKSQLRTSFSFNTSSPIMKQFIQCAKLLCLTSQPVLIYAESGCEAPLIAHCIHANSDCTKKGNFISADCGCWNDGEQQSDYLFGYGPKANNDFAHGVLGHARDGTLFLDNIEALALPVQARLYHAIRYHSLLYPDTNAVVSINFRLVARTKLSAQQILQKKAIIPELFSMLSAMSIEMPPLRDTVEDIPRFALEHFRHCCNKYNRYLTLSDEAIELLKTYRWDGNLLQLRMFIERLVIFAETQVVGVNLIKAHIQQIDPENYESRQTASPEVISILEALRTHNGDREATAEELGISKTTLWRWMKKYGITTKF